MVPKILLMCWLIVAVGCSTQPKWRGDLLGITELQKDTAAEMALPPPSAIITARSTGDAYRIGVLDELVVTVWGREDLGSQILESSEGARRVSVIREDGSLLLPFLPPIAASGLSVEKLQSFITHRYAEVIKNPQVEVRVVEYRSQPIHLESGVRRPGVVYLTPNIRSLSDVIAAAGGLDGAAVGSQGILMRDDERSRLVYRNTNGSPGSAANMRMQGGDWLQFPLLNERVVYVLGEVGRQRKLPIPTHGLSVMEALSDADGFDRVTANLKSIYLLRQTSQGSRIYRVSLEQLMEVPDTQLLAGDRLFIPSTGLAKWDRTWRQLLPIFSAGGNSTTIYRGVGGVNN